MGQGMLLDRNTSIDSLNRHKQTPLMLAVMHGRLSCVEKLLEAGANMLVFDSLHEMTCLHYAAYYGHSDCLKAILSAARSSPVAASWGYARFVNIRDGKGTTPLATRQMRPECVHILLDRGALVCASTGGYGYPGCTPLHLAARGGSLDCIRELLTGGADRVQRDASGRIPHVVASKHKHGAEPCGRRTFCVAISFEVHQRTQSRSKNAVGASFYGGKQGVGEEHPKNDRFLSPISISFGFRSRRRCFRVLLFT